MADKNDFENWYLRVDGFYGFDSLSKMKHCDFVLRDSCDYINCIIWSWNGNENHGCEWSFEVDEKKVVKKQKVSLLN